MFHWFEQRINPYPEEVAQAAPENLFAFIWYYAKPAGPWLALVGTLSALIAMGEVYSYSFLGTLVDWLSSHDRADFLALEGHKLLGMAALILIGLPGLVALASVVNHQSLLGNFPMNSRWRMHRYLLRQSLGFYADEFAGRVATRLMQTSLAVRDAVMKLLDVFVYVVVYFFSMVVVMLTLDWRLAMPLVVWIITYLAMLVYFVPRLKAVSAQQADARSMMTGRIVDSYTNIATVKLFSHARREEAYAKDAMDGFLVTVHKQMRLVTKLETLVYFSSSVLLFAIAAQSIMLWLQGTVSVGAIAVAIGLTLRIFGLSHWIMWEVAAFFEQVGIVMDGKTMFSKRQLVVDHDGAKPLVASHGLIEFDQVCFHYGKGGGVIEQLSLTIAPGEKVGLVGRSGAGKTTLMNLLLRFFDAEQGAVRIDGQNVSLISQDSLRASIGVVTQDTSLLHRSVRENIAYGRPEATEEQIIAAAERANAMEFIAGLRDPKGRQSLDATVGERGVKLSGGQRQRIAIARVFLKDAPILVLDEATSALDSEVEAAIQENLFKLMEGKTVIAIAHRLSTIAQLDRLIVLDEGRIVEMGSHIELVASGGLYAQLWLRQSGGFLEMDEG